MLPCPATEHGLEWRERTLVLLLLLLLLGPKLRLGLRLETLLEFGDGGAGEGARGDVTTAQGPAVETGQVCVVALAQDLAAADDDGAVTVVQGREGGLVQAGCEVGVVAGRHF